MKEESEFGRGLVVCLVKFAEHFWNRSAEELRELHTYHTKPEKQHRNFGKNTERIKRRIGIRGTIEKVISSQMEMWANGASDHLYEIMVPKRFKGTELETKIKELQELGLEIGHGFRHEKQWGFADYTKLWTLTEECAVLIDENIGLKRQVDLGEW